MSRKIYEITLALSNYYRTSLNKGKNILSFEQELSNMQSYLKIQQIMHDNSFDVVINVSEEVMPCESLNLILQPLVEKCNRPRHRSADRQERHNNRRG